MGEWKEYRLGDICKKIGSGATPRGGDSSYKETGISLIRSQNVLDLKFSREGLAFIDALQADELSNVIVHSKDVLLNITGDSVARSCMVPEAILPARVNQHVAIIRPDCDSLDNHFLLYTIHAIKEELLSLAEIGATRRALTKGMIEGLILNLPPLPEQRAIASVLSSLDDKIDLLHRQNKTLESLAETLFRQWFVEEEQEEWEETNLYEVVELVGGGTPKTEIAEYWNGDICWISGRDISASHKGFITATEKKITQLGIANSSAKVLPTFATLISARGTVGKYCLLGEPMAFSQTNYGILPKIDDCYFFTYLLVAHSVEELRMAAYGSVFDTITTNSFKEHEIVIPKESEITRFEEQVKSYFQKMLSNTQTIRTLTHQRDLLLQRLMRGEVRVR